MNNKYWTIEENTKKEKVKDKIMDKLNRMSINGFVRLHTKDIHTSFIEKGRGSCCVDRYLRKMRQEGLIDYEDPRKNNYFYKIKINKETK